jgi:Ca-activated chloride channel family protein
LALAGPRWGHSFQNARRRGVDVVVAVDVSASMRAEDVAPNRLVQAKRELGLLIDGLQGDRVGVVAFAGAAFLQCPLTLDRAAARSILDLIDPDLIPTPGTDLAAALEESMKAFPEGARRNKALVLLTDGEDHSGRLDAAVRRAREKGVTLFTVGFGNTTGDVIPLRDAQGNVTGYKKDKDGKTVVSKMDETALRDMASRTGGAYHRATQGEIEIDRILKDIDGMEKKTLEDRTADRTRDRSSWPLAVALLLLLVEFVMPERMPLRRLLRGAPLLLLWAAAPIHADDPSVGVRPSASASVPAPQKEDRAVRLWRERAAQRPDDPDVAASLGHALFRAGAAAEAAQAFDHVRTLSVDPARQAEAAYNAGAALAAAGKTDDALERFKDAMRLSPDDPDAKNNYEFLMRQKKSGGKGGASDKKGKESEAKKDDQTTSAGDADKDKKNSARAPQLKPGDLSKEDAERILQAVERQEKDARRKVKMPSMKPSSENDW